MDQARRAYSYIRYSTPAQALGGSLLRQIKAGEKYARERGLVIDRTVQDLGLSAFKGDHLEGEFGKLFDAIKSGAIPKGSVLLVENLDRLSREKVSTALLRFLSIIEGGIEIVTLADGMSYTEESLGQNNGLLFASLGTMMRANDESRRKSYNNLHDWQKRRARIAGGKKVCRTGPSWLEWDEAGKRFKAHPARAKAVREIFRLQIDYGWGFIRIARRLNDTGVACWATPDLKWSMSAVRNILLHRGVTGHFQPRRMEGKKQVPVGDPVLDYFPKIISFEDFERAQAIRRLNSGTGGRKQNPVINLISGKVFCRECGSVILCKANSRQSNSYVCKRAYDNRGCTNRNFNSIRIIEGVLLDGAGMLASSTLLPHLNRPAEPDDEADRLRAGIQAVTEKRARLFDQFGASGDKQALEIIAKLAQDIAVMEAELAAVTREASFKNTRLTIGQIDAMVRQLRDDCYSEDLAVKEDARGRVSVALRQLIHRVEIDGEKVAHVTCTDDRMTFRIREGRAEDVVFNVNGVAWRLLDDGRMEEVSQATPRSDCAADSFFRALGQAVPEHELSHPRLVTMLGMTWKKQGKIREGSRDWLAAWLEANAAKHGIQVPPSIRTALKAQPRDQQVNG